MKAAACSRTRRLAIATLGAIVLGLAGASGASALPSEIVDELRAADAPRAELEQLDRADLPRGAELFRFQQEVEGLPVFGSYAVVADPAEGAAEFLATDETSANVASPSDPEITRDEAIETATKATGASELRGEASAELGIEPGEGGTTAWNVALPSGKPLADFVVLVDAVQGNVIEKEDILQRSIGIQSADAKLYRPNPVVESPRRYTGLSDSGDDDSKKLTKLRRPVVLPNLLAGQNCLQGVYVYVVQGPNENQVCSAAHDFSGVKRKANNFEALMAYYHIDRTLAYLNGPNVGANISPGKDDDLDGPGGDSPRGRQYVVANIDNKDNSFYSPISTYRFIGLGSGGIDDGEDGDVIVHEYGHSIQDDQIPGPGPNGEGSFDTFEGSAMGEGFGDYLSAVMSQRYEDENGAINISNTDNVCIFDWDGLGYNHGCGRRADIERTVSNQSFRCGSSFHCLGQVWSSALWALRSAEEPGLGDPSAALGTAMDKILLGSHPLLNQNSNFDDAGYALFQADEIIYPAGTSGDGKGQHYQALVDETVCRELVNGSCF